MRGVDTEEIADYFETIVKKVLAVVDNEEVPEFVQRMVRSDKELGNPSETVLMNAVALSVMEYATSELIMRTSNRRENVVLFSQSLYALVVSKTMQEMVENAIARRK